MRFPFLVAVALVAAALADPIVESIANAGTFGPGYADNTHVGVIPTVVLGAILAAGILAGRCFDVLRGMAHAVGTRTAASDFPIVFALQLAALFALESGEQLAVDGRLAGGLTWLGGPILFSLLAHAAIGVVCTLALGALLRALVRAFASVVRTALAFLWTLLRDRIAADVRSRRRSTTSLRAQAPHVRQIGGRAPPLLAALA